MENNKLNKILGIPSIILGVSFPICQFLLNIMKEQELKLEYEMINKCINIAFISTLILIVLIAAGYIRINYHKIKEFSKGTAIGYFCILIGLSVVVHTSNVNLISPIFVLLGGILLVCSKEKDFWNGEKNNPWKIKRVKKDT